MFSKRLAYLHDKNKLTRLLEDKRLRGVEIIDLVQSNPTQSGFTYPKEEILAAISDPGSLHYSPTPLGLQQAREAVARYYERRGHVVPYQDIMLTCSTSEAYSYLFKLLANCGDEVLVPCPGYPLFDFLASAESLNTVPYPLFYDDGWQLDLPQLGKCIIPRSRAIILVHPNHPTGSFLKASEWEYLQKICRLHQLPILCDEVFFDYVLDLEGAQLNLLEEQDILVFVLNGLSKIAGLPQLKMSWILVRGPWIRKQEALDKLEILSDTFLSVATPVQHAVPRLLELGKQIQKQIQERIECNLDVLKQRLSPSSATCLRVEGGWYEVIRLPRTRSAEEWSLKLLDHYHTLTHPGDFYGFGEEDFLVISLLADQMAFGRGVQRIAQALQE